MSETHVNPKEAVADGLENITGHHAVCGSVVSWSFRCESGHGTDCESSTYVQSHNQWKNSPMLPTQYATKMQDEVTILLE